MPTLDFSRNPDIGDTVITDYRLIQRRNLANRLITFRSEHWVTIDSFNFTISSLPKEEIDLIIAFIQNSAGQEITLIDYDSIIWTGIIIENPKIEQVGPNFADRDLFTGKILTRHESCDYKITLTLEGAFAIPS